VYVEVIQEAMYDVGRRWERNEISVADEHVATAITQFVLSRLYQEMTAGSAVRGRVVLSGVEGEMHQVGLSMLADILEVNGFEVSFVGTNLPRQSVIDLVRATSPQVLGVSATMPFNVGAVGQLVRDVKSQLGAQAPRVVLGGRAFAHAPEIWKELGADAYARDLRDAIEVVEALAAAS
jgi:methanogenic corrinoid protein MtbC1